MDAFYASIEQRDNPSLRGKPVVVGAPPDQRGVVSTCSYEARRYGIRSAMPSRTAARLCPHAVFLPVRMAHYEAVSESLQTIFLRYTPLVEPLSLDEAFLDVTGAYRLFGPGPAIAAAIRRDVAAELSLTCSVGVAPNKFLAKLASDLRKPDALVVVPSSPAEIRAFLAPLPLSRLWGIGPATLSALARGALSTIGDLQTAPLPLLRHLLGPAAAAQLRDLSLGIDARPVAPPPPPKSISRETTFLHDESDPRALQTALLELSDDVARRLRADGRLAATARLKLRYADFTTLTRQLPFPSPTRDAEDLLAAARTLFASIPLSQPVRLLGYGVTRLASPSAPNPADATGDLFAPRDSPAARRRRAALQDAIDAIRRDHGPSAIHRASLPPEP
jgi:DNA polymerase-4